MVHLDPVTVLRYARRGLIESVPIGRRRFFRDAAIQAFIDSRIQPATSKPRETRPTGPARNPNRTYKT